MIEHAPGPRDAVASQWRGVRPWTRHGLVLAVAGMVYVLVGLAYILSDPTPARTASLALALRWAPLPVWGGVFVAVGLLAALSARWPPASEKWGYATMTGLSSGWAGIYVVGILFGAPLQGFSGALVWALLAFLWWAISGLVNPTDKDR